MCRFWAAVEVRWSTIAAFVLLARRPSTPHQTAVAGVWEACKAWACCWAHVQGSGRLGTLFHPLQGLPCPCAGPRKPQNDRWAFTPFPRLGGPHHFYTAVGGRLLCLPIFSAFVAVQILGGSGGTVVHHRRICSAGKEAVNATSDRRGGCVGGLQGVGMLLGACTGLRKVGDVVPPPGGPPLPLRRA